MRRPLRREVFHHFYDGGTGFFARAHVFYAMESADVPTLRVLLEARANVNVGRSGDTILVPPPIPGVVRDPNPLRPHPSRKASVNPRKRKE